MNKKFREKFIVLVVPSTEFAWHEYETIRKILEDSGCEVFTSSDNSIEAISKTGESISIDGALSEIDVSKYDGIFFIGGPGTISCLNTPQAYRLVKDAKKMGLVYGAIDLAVRILAYANGLTGIAVTGLNTDGELEGILIAHGARYRKTHEHKKPDIIIDKNVITANGQADAEGFAQGILKLLNQKDEGVVQKPLPKRW